MYCFFVFSFYVFPFPTLPTACSHAHVTSARVFLERTIHTCIDCFSHPLYLLLPSVVYFRYKCLFVTSVGVFKNEVITWMYCWLVFCCHFFQFFTLPIACLFAFVTPAGVFLERAIHMHAFIRFQLFQPRSYM